MGKGLTITGFILSLVSLVSAWLPVPFLPFAGLPMAIVGLILSVVGGKKLKANGQKSGLATAGMVIGIIAVVLSAIGFFTCGVFVACAACAVA